MQTVTQIAKDILAREGGYVNDPYDPGWATNHGVTVHTMRRLGLDLTGDGIVDSEDVQVLDAARATDVYRSLFPRAGLGRFADRIAAISF